MTVSLIVAVFNDSVIFWGGDSVINLVVGGAAPLREALKTSAIMMGEHLQLSWDGLASPLGKP